MRITLIAHDGKKSELLAFAFLHIEILKSALLCTTGTHLQKEN